MCWKSHCFNLIVFNVKSERTTLYRIFCPSFSSALMFQNPFSFVTLLPLFPLFNVTRHVWLDSAIVCRLVGSQRAPWMSPFLPVSTLSLLPVIWRVRSVELFLNASTKKGTDLSLKVLYSIFKWARLVLRFSALHRPSALRLD